jgi:hypothetical protein
LFWKDDDERRAGVSCDGVPLMRAWWRQLTHVLSIVGALVLLAGCTGTSTSGGSAGYGGNSGAWSDDSSGGNYNFSDGSGSNTVTGSGRLISRQLPVSGVTSVVIGASFVVHVALGAPEQATIRFDDNLADLIDARVSNGTLRIGLKPGSSVRNATMTAEVTVRQLDRLRAAGASDVTLASAPAGPALQLDVSGASKLTGPVRVDRLEVSEAGACVVTLSGNAGSMRLTAAGASQLRGGDLSVADLDATLSGASQATVAVSHTLAATADGVSMLRYRGSPRITRQQTSGVSSIVQDSP